MQYRFIVCAKFMVAKADDSFSAIVVVKSLNSLEWTGPHNRGQIIDEVVLNNLFSSGCFVSRRGSLADELCEMFQCRVSW